MVKAEVGEWILVDHGHSCLYSSEFLASKRVLAIPTPEERTL